MRRILLAVLAAVLLAGACGDDADGGVATGSPGTEVPTSEPPAVTAVPPTPAVPSPTVPPATEPPTTDAPAPVCELADVGATLDAAVADARLAPGGDWSTDVAGNVFAAATAPGDRWAEVLGLDCGVQLAQDGTAGDRLALVAWTGPRMAFVIRATELSEPPLAVTSMITVGFENPRGEYLRADNSLWGGVLDSGDTLVVGHLDFNLGVAAKTFAADAPPFGEEEPTLEAERVGIAAMRAAGARNVGIAQPAEFGSEEGTVMFVSPTGQILVVDVAPEGWFDPMLPRYYHGPTTVADIGGVAVRVTEAAPGEEEFTVGVELGWTCEGHVWILEPAGNGTGDEMVAFVATVLAADDC